MSFNNNNNNNDWNNDPNNFSNATGRRAGDNWEDTNNNPSSQNQGDNWNRGQQQPGQQQPGQQAGYGYADAYRGNTSDVNTIGAGGDFGNAGRDAGQQRDVRSGDNWGNSNQTPGNNVSDQRCDDPSHFSGSGAHNDGTHDSSAFDSDRTSKPKPSMGDKLMGGMEKMAGKVTGNEGMQERGAERKVSSNSAHMSHILTFISM
ncbi:hypothetical protein PHLCEN_2v11877 [Hermanssonia centrifuga]|uniref:Uncharacterized protein n=1 Tax=Hermanssonia centrifuga TaxID=98765 RepID=A0A2R6NIR9_9APHY|nr:hypothetical protein PHLCEN_2v11877 [Hermanssonia centrifuga]